jgi:hypothetical protein
MASTADDEPVAAQGNTGDPQSGPADERTPLLDREAAEPSTEAVAGSAFSENIKKWRRQRWISLSIAFILVATIVILTLLFGGWSTLILILGSPLPLLAAPYLNYLPIITV